MLGSIDEYETKWQTIQIGCHSIELLTLSNFEKAIDDLLAKLEARGEKDIAPEVCPYFGQIWASAHSLASFVADHPEIFAGKRVLEIGCGLALPSLIAARLGAKVDCMDLHGDVVHFIKANLQKNDLAESVTYHTLDWQQSGEFFEPFDVVMASDVLYEKHHAISLAKFIKRVLKKNGKGVFTDPCRWHHLEFVSALELEDFSVNYEYSWTKEEGRDLKLVTIEVN